MPGKTSAIYQGKLVHWLLYKEMASYATKQIIDRAKMMIAAKVILLAVL